MAKTCFSTFKHFYREEIDATAQPVNGYYFTPREVNRPMVSLLFIEDDDALTKPTVVRSPHDPTAGSGGMLSVAKDHLSSQIWLPDDHRRANEKKQEG